MREAIYSFNEYSFYLIEAVSMSPYVTSGSFYLGNQCHLHMETQVKYGPWRNKKLSLGFLTKQDSNQSPQLQRLAKNATLFEQVYI